MHLNLQLSSITQVIRIGLCRGRQGGKALKVLRAGKVQPAGVVEASVCIPVVSVAVCARAAGASGSEFECDFRKLCWIACRQSR